MKANTCERSRLVMPRSSAAIAILVGDVARAAMREHPASTPRLRLRGKHRTNFKGIESHMPTSPRDTALILNTNGAKRSGASQGRMTPHPCPAAPAGGAPRDSSSW